MKKGKLLVAVLGLVLGSSAVADPISDFNTGWAGKALARQRVLDQFSPLKDNNILGTHNSYNSLAYQDSDSYWDPNQIFSIYDQLRMGARFIELDAHWTEHAHGWPQVLGQDLLLCYSNEQIPGYPHSLCGLTDRFVRDGLQEVRTWLDENPKEVIILYIQDFTEGHHQELLNSLNDKLGGRIYASGGCKAIPDTLTKAQVLRAGKQVVLWKDGGCSSNTGMAALAYTSLGNLERTWEDRAILGDGSKPLIGPAEVDQAFKTGLPPDCNNGTPCNIVNLDNMRIDDGRLQAGVWSWDVSEPNNYDGNQDCAVQWDNGRWDDNQCERSHPYACRQSGDPESWVITRQSGPWSGGAAACAALGSGYVFDVPTNSFDNEKLKAVKAGVSHVWLNHNDITVEGQWNPGNEIIVKHSGMCIEVKYGSTQDGAQLVQWPCHGGDNQRWILRSTDDGFVTIEAKHSGKCIDGVSGANGTQLIQWSCHGGDNQKWTLRSTDDGFVMLQAKHSGRCFDVEGKSTANGARLLQWSCYPGGPEGQNQKFSYAAQQ